MKTSFYSLSIALLSAYCLSASAEPQHGGGGQNPHAAAEAPATVSIRQNDGALCGTAFYDDLYALTVAVFAIGAEKVEVSDYREQVFGLIRSAEEFKGFAEEWVEHAKDIPRQLVEIIREDSSVLDSCDNFSVALVGPP